MNEEVMWAIKALMHEVGIWMDADYYLRNYHAFLK
jgi:hypothetical protein